jgi:hypothetical protein
LQSQKEPTAVPQTVLVFNVTHLDAHIAMPSSNVFERTPQVRKQTIMRTHGHQSQQDVLRLADLSRVYQGALLLSLFSNPHIT